VLAVIIVSAAHYPYNVRESVSALGAQLSPSQFPSVCLSVCLSVGRSVQKVYCGKMADWIRMLFGVMSGVGRGMRVLNGRGDCRREGGVLGVNVGRPFVTNEDGDALFPNIFGENLFRPTLQQNLK